MTLKTLTTMVLLAATPALALKLTTSDNVQLSAQYIPGKSPKATIIVAPALGVPMRHYNSKFAELFPHYNLMFFDHRGQGESGETPGIRSPVSQALEFGKHHFHDVLAALEYARSQSSLPVILYGSCAGSFHTAHAALYLQREGLLQAYGIKGVILESSWASLYDAGLAAYLTNIRSALKALVSPHKESSAFYWVYGAGKEAVHGVDWFFGDKLRAHSDALNFSKQLAHFPLPIFFIHSFDDEVIPFSHGFLLSKKAKDCRCWWIEAGRSRHVSHHIYVANEFQERVNSFSSYALSK